MITILWYPECHSYRYIQEEFCPALGSVCIGLDIYRIPGKYNQRTIIATALHLFNKQYVKELRLRLIVPVTNLMGVGRIYIPFTH